MAIAVDMTYTVSGMDTYHKACSQLGFADEQHAAPGILFHWIEAVDGGFVSGVAMTYLFRGRSDSGRIA